MPNNYDIIQGRREQRFSEHLTRDTADSREFHRYMAHLIRTAERQRRDMQWVESREAAEELAKPSYRGHWIYVGNRQIAGAARNPRRARQMARKRCHIDPDVLVCLYIPR